MQFTPNIGQRDEQWKYVLIQCNRVRPIVFMGMCRRVSPWQTAPRATKTLTILWPGNEILANKYLAAIH